MIDWQIYKYDTLTSTNDKALDLTSQIHKTFVVQADKQTNARGRRGRSWKSMDGNLFFSLGLKFNLQDIGILVEISSLSLLETIKTLNDNSDLQLKWPNDVLLNGAKVSGILLEKGECGYIIVGIGVNICKYPQDKDILYPTTSLLKAGIQTDKNVFLKLFLDKLSSYLENWPEKRNSIKEKWMQYAKGLNKEIIVKLENKEIIGTFKGVDNKANLLLETTNGMQTVLAGDVFMKDKDD